MNNFLISYLKPEGRPSEASLNFLEIMNMNDLLNLVYSIDFHRLANATDANSDVSFVHHHFLIPDVVCVSNIQPSCQLTTLIKRKSSAKIASKLKTYFARKGKFSSTRISNLVTIQFCDHWRDSSFIDRQVPFHGTTAGSRLVINQIGWSGR